MGGQCCVASNAEKQEKRSLEEPEGVELMVRSVDESKNAIVSTMRLEVRIQCEGLPPLEGKAETEKYVMSYKIEYGSSQQIWKWSEKFENNSRPKISNKPCILPYEMGTDQTMRISLYRYEDFKELRDPVPRPPYGNVLLDLNEAIVAKSHEVRKRVIVLDEAYKMAETYITVSVAEKKQENLAQLLLQLEVTECKLKGPLYFTCYQHVGDGVKYICESSLAEQKKTSPKTFTFEPLVLSSEAFEGSWEDKTLSFIFEDGSSANKKVTTGLIRQGLKAVALCTVGIKELLQPHLQELAVETRNKRFGKVMIKNRTVEPILTLGSILFSNVKLVPIVAVDCSLGNLTFDNLKCMHHFDKIRPNLYIEALNAVESRAFPFYSKMLGYGFGAKIIPKKSRLSSCFALNGNIFDPAVKTRDDLVNSYIKTIKSVELCLPVNYSEVIKTAKGLARLELQEFNRRYRYSQHDLNSSGTNAVTSMLQNYYVLYILTAGVLDDAEEVFNECAEIAGLPLSIIFVKIGNQQMKDVDDLGEIKKRIESAYCSKRLFLSIVEFDRVYNDLTNFGKFLISSVPTQILQFFKMTQHKMSGSMSDLTADPTTATPAREVKPPSEEDEKEAATTTIKQQGLNPASEDTYAEYFEKLKMEYYQKMRERSVNSTDIERIIKNGVPEADPDLPLEFIKKDHK